MPHGLPSRIVSDCLSKSSFEVSQSSHATSRVLFPLLHGLPHRSRNHLCYEGRFLSQNIFRGVGYCDHVGFSISLSYLLPQSSNIDRTISLCFRDLVAWIGIGTIYFECLKRSCGIQHTELSRSDMMTRCRPPLRHRGMDESHAQNHDIRTTDRRTEGREGRAD